MRIIHQVEELQHWLGTHPKKIGFVPTMGTLHQGHLSLMKKAQKENDFTLVSIFVNPLQFNQIEDFTHYPRNEKEDIAFLKKHRACDVLFIPSYEEIYAMDIDISKVNILDLANKMEGMSRPKHFEGVLKVVKRLFEITSPTKAYFGLKDYQQCLIVEKMVMDLNLGIELRFCPISRERSGLARSSRNKRLSTEARKKGALIYQNLQEVKKGFSIALKIGWQKLNHAKSKLALAGFEVDYFHLVDGKKLELVAENEQIPKECRLFVAASIEGVRLIDNIAL